MIHYRQNHSLLLRKGAHFEGEWSGWFIHIEEMNMPPQKILNAHCTDLVQNQQKTVSKILIFDIPCHPSYNDKLGKSQNVFLFKM